MGNIWWGGGRKLDEGGVIIRGGAGSEMRVELYKGEGWEVK